MRSSRETDFSLPNPAFTHSSAGNPGLNGRETPLRLDQSGSGGTGRNWEITSSCASSICRSTSWTKALFSPASYVTYIDYRSLRADLARRGASRRRLSRGTRDVPSAAASATFLTAALDPYPADLRGDVGCQHGVLLLVVVDERRHLGHGHCAIDHRREPDGDFDWNFATGDKAISQTRSRGGGERSHPRSAIVFSPARDHR